MFKSKYSKQYEQLEQFLGARAEQLSRVTGFVRRQSKLSGAVFVQAVVLSWLERPTGSLSEVAASCGELGVEISEAGLQQRLTERAVALLQGLFQEGLQQLPRIRQLPKGVLAHFKALYVLDSTTIQLPANLKGVFAGQDYKSSKASAKIFLSFDYMHGRLEAVEVVGGREADQNCQQHVQLAQVGSLHLFDLGFFKQHVFEQLAKAEAYFISRLQTQTAVYCASTSSTPLDLVSLLATSATSQGDVEVELGHKTHLRVRLIFQKLPDKVVEERRRQAKKKARHKGYTCSQRHLDLLAWSIFITNVPRHWLNASQIMLLYRLRWQVELIFKLWKSQAKLDVVAHCGPHRFLCQFYARLLALLVFHWLLDPAFDPDQAERSLPKAFALLQRYASRLRLALADPALDSSSLFQKLEHDLHRFALKQKRRKSPSTLARILAAGV